MVDIPPVRAQFIEYQLHTLRCPQCQLLTEAAWPEKVPRSAFGPSVQAWVGLLSGAYRLSKRNIVTLLSDAFGVDLALGSVSQLEQHVSEAVAAPVAEACDYIQKQPTLHIDETGWREARAKAWLWTVASGPVTAFAIRSGRDREVARELLGEDPTAIVGSDRFTVYDYLPVRQRQACWAHLERTFELFVERGGQAATVGKTLLRCSHQMFTWWHRVRDGTLQRSSFQVYLSDLRSEVRFQLGYGRQFADEKTAATCANLLAMEPALWTFARKEGVEPTNNAAERALRHGVLWRHTSFGTHSESGSLVEPFDYLDSVVLVYEVVDKQDVGRAVSLDGVEQFGPRGEDLQVAIRANFGAESSKPCGSVKMTVVDKPDLYDVGVQSAPCRRAPAASRAAVRPRHPATCSRNRRWDRRPAAGGEWARNVRRGVLRTGCRAAAASDSCSRTTESSG